MPLLDTPVPTYDEDLYTDAAVLDPHPHYRALRDLGPAVWLPRHDLYALTRYADVRAALADPETFSSASGIALNDVTNGVLAGTMLASDAPLHDHLRQVVAHRLTPRALRGRAADIATTADALVDGLVARGEFEVVTDLAYAMPMAVVPDFLGWPQRGRDMLRPWAWGALQALGPIHQQRTVDGFPLAQALGEYAAGLAAERDLLSGSLGASLLEAADRGDISAEQVPMLLLDYLGPSIDTTAGAIANALGAFAHHPDQWARLRSSPELIPDAFNEVVRFESPLRAFTRVTTRDTTVDGTAIPAGSRVLVVYASANRDERRWERPDEFDIGRDASEHLGFGYGVHGCAGQGMARLETHAVLAALARRVERFEFVTPPERAVNNTLRTYAAMPVRIVPA